ncbi:cytochrome b561 [Gallaecimonas pentaromativorans]|uniref:Cytochrome b561 n=2 Tax=Gallaecimonas pentaromativorans TaxID=584787 RepID=A0A3N1PBM1_9GAMM|nr:cytochrome b561 [Gallaecimonas pentaromativorans]
MMKDQFHIVIRLLHWLMALAIFTMLFVGAGMVSSVANRDWLYDLHKPLGITILVLAILRLVVRLSSRTPPLPSNMPLFMQLVAKLSHVLLYGLMLALPMIGWLMLSAGGYPVTLGGGIELPALVAKSNSLYAVLRPLHTLLAYSLLLLVLGHMAAALFHGLIRRDGVLRSITFGK